MSNEDKYTYHVEWSEQDGEYIATVDQILSYSYRADTTEEALEGIKEQVRHGCVLDALSEDADVERTLSDLLIRHGYDSGR